MFPAKFLRAQFRSIFNLSSCLSGVALGIVVLITAANSAPASEVSDHVVQLTATVQEAPAQIRLNWPTVPNAVAYAVSRKAPSSAFFSSLATLPADAISYTDDTVVTGTAYEYQVLVSPNSLNAYGYVMAGIALPAVDQRGTVTVVVDASQATALASELSRLSADLIGDGWKVIRHDVPRQSTADTTPATLAEASAVRALIQADWAADPQVKAALLIGRVPLPYSGIVNPDGHDEHKGAWPADTFYGDVDGTWTDTTANVSGGVRTTNVPGDGRFDQDTVFSVEVAVGRVDMSAMGSFGDETTLLRRYLDKDHAFRQHQNVATARGIIDDNFGWFNGEGFARTGFMTFTACFGIDNTQERDFLSTLSPGSGSALWAYGCGGGWYTSCSGVGSSSDLIGQTPQVIFTAFFGSYFGDYDTYDNFLRAPLAGPGWALTSCWAGRPQWYFHRMAMGEPIGSSVLLSQNNQFVYGPSSSTRRGRHMGFLGDPTLRLHVLAPAANVTASLSGSNAVLNWSASADAGLGYHVYRAPNTNGVFTRLTTTPVTTTSFTDSAPPLPAVFQVRAVALTTSASGSYVNTSQGAFATVNSGDTAPTFTASPVDQTVVAGATATFTVSAYGAPTPTVQWQRNGADISGATGLTYTTPATVVADSGASFVCVASNGVGTVASSAATLTVTASNTAPVVNAGLDQTITLPAAATLNGSVTDDGKPSGKLISVWSQGGGSVQGGGIGGRDGTAGTVTFGNAALTITTATFSAPGTYVLILSANDTALSASDTLTITVLAATAVDAALVRAHMGKTNRDSNWTQAADIDSNGRVDAVDLNIATRGVGP